jgi:wobble nucleotide-excising tRNase
MDQDPGLARKVVIVDDPISSLDHHRTSTTVQVLRRLGRRVSQLIVLSHNKPFLFRLWDGIDSALRTSLKIDRDANGSTITPWDVERDSITEHDRRHEMLRSYSANGQNGDSRQVAESLRIVLEGFLRVACPEHYPRGRRALAQFMARCRERCSSPNEILNARDLEELNDLVEYANLFHHDTNPARETQIISDQELHGFVARVLNFTRRQ